MHRHLGSAAACAAAALLLIGAPARLIAQFANAEVSGSGTPPFLLADDAWIYERLDGWVTYTIYESAAPRQGFAALVDGRRSAGGSYGHLDGGCRAPEDRAAPVQPGHRQRRIR